MYAERTFGRALPDLDDVHNIADADNSLPALDGCEAEHRRLALPFHPLEALHMMIKLDQHMLAGDGRDAADLDQLATLKLSGALVIRQSSSEGSAFLPRLLPRRLEPDDFLGAALAEPLRSRVGTPPPRL